MNSRIPTDAESNPEAEAIEKLLRAPIELSTKYQLNPVSILPLNPHSFFNWSSVLEPSEEDEEREMKQQYQRWETFIEASQPPRNFALEALEAQAGEARTTDLGRLLLSRAAQPLSKDREKEIYKFKR